MERKLLVKFLIGFLILQRNILGTKEMPIEPPKQNISNSRDNEIYLDAPKLFSQKKDIVDIRNVVREIQLDPKLEYNISSIEVDKHNILLLEKHANIKPVGDYTRKTLRHKGDVHNTENILFMITALILVGVHLFFMEMFIRWTRLRFQNSTRYQYLSMIHLFLSFLVCAVYFLLVLLHYKADEYCN